MTSAAGRIEASGTMAHIGVQSSRSTERLIKCVSSRRPTARADEYTTEVQRIQSIPAARTRALRKAEQVTDYGREKVAESPIIPP